MFNRVALRCGAAVFFAAAACSHSLGAVPGGYPERPLRLIVPFPPGGGIDIVARILGQELTVALGQPTVFDNRPGASGTLGTTLAAKATPDGYTMLVGSFGPLTSGPSVYKNLAYDPVKDFSPVSLLVFFPNVLLVHPSSPLKSVHDIITSAKASPGRLNYASSGIGSPPHLAMELFKAAAQLEIVHVPYKGGPIALNDLLGGRVNMMFINTLTAVPFVRGGKLRALAVTAPSRSPVFPDVPTMAEAGELPGFAASDRVGLLLPAGAPAAVVKKLNAEVVRALTSTDASAKLSQRGAEPVTSIPGEFASFMRTELAKWRKVIRDAGIPAQ